MKKYFNKSLFYQGDASIFLPLCLVYIGIFIFLLIDINNYFYYDIKMYLYNQINQNLIVSFENNLILIAYISIIYIITVGVFKRKKWSTFLSGPFSRIDIRTRELIIILISVIIYIVIFLFIVCKNYIQHYEILRYINDFYKIIIYDVLRIFSMSMLLIGCIALLDSIFANLYYLIGGVIFSFIYILLFINNYSYIFNYYMYGKFYGRGYVYNGVTEYITGRSIGNEMSFLQVNCISIIFIGIGIILLIISKILTNKMLVENMNEGIIFNLPKKIGYFMMVTFIGLLVAPFLSDIIAEVYYRPYIEEYKAIILRSGLIVIISILAHITFKNIKSAKKDSYY